MSPRVQRPQPPYLQVAQHYRDLIQRGELREGDRLPSARQLTEEWGVAHATAAKVLATLRAEGLVRTIPGGGGGTIVSDEQTGQAPRDRMISVKRWGKIYPPDEHARIVSAELVDAPEHVAQALGLDVGASAIRRHRVTFREDTPVSASTSWFGGTLAAVAPDLLVPARILLGTPGYIAEMTGRSLRSGCDQVTAALADAQLASELQIPEGSPVLVGRNWVRDSDGDPIEFGEYFSVPSRWQTYEYELG